MCGFVCWEEWSVLWKVTNCLSVDNWIWHVYWLGSCTALLYLCTCLPNSRDKLGEGQTGHVYAWRNNKARWHKQDSVWCANSMKLHSTTIGSLDTITSVVQLPFLPCHAIFWYFADRASQYIYLNINQLDALNFIMSLFHAHDDEHFCSKHVEAWNKLIIKFSGSSSLILR